VNFVEVGTVRDHAVQGTLNGYNADCMTIHISNTAKLGDTNVGPLPANYPDFWYWAPCSDIGTAGPGEWGKVDSITLTINDCGSVATQPTTWGNVKSMYRK